MNFSIHTFELIQYISQDEYHRVRDLFIADSISTYRVRCDRLNFKPYKYTKNGLRIEMDKDHYHGFYVKFTINLKAVIEPGNDYEIFDADSDDVENAFNMIDDMLAFLGNEYTINKLQLSRIDHCKDVNLNDLNYVRDIISLAKKSIKRKGFQDTYSSDTKKKMKKKYNDENSFDMTNKSRGISIVLYSKYHQLIDIKAFEPQRAFGILRAELKIHHPVIDGLTNCEFIRYCIMNSRDVFKRNTSDIFTNGVYMKLNTARKYINMQNERKKLKDMLISVFEEISQAQKFRTGYKKTVEKYNLDSREQTNIKTWLKANSINPVTISVRKVTIACMSIYSILELNDAEECEKELVLLQKIGGYSLA
jgi:hypothetical protein